MPASETPTLDETIERLRERLGATVAAESVVVMGDDDRPERSAAWAAALRDALVARDLLGAGQPVGRLAPEDQDALASLVERAGLQVEGGEDLAEVLRAVEKVVVEGREALQSWAVRAVDAMAFVAKLRRGWLRADGETASRFVAQADAVFAKAGIDPDDLPAVEQ